MALSTKTSQATASSRLRTHNDSEPVGLPPASPGPSSQSQQNGGGVSPPGAKHSPTRNNHLWKHHLFLLQQQAPQPRHVPCVNDVPRKPWYYGSEFHGLIPRQVADQLLIQHGKLFLHLTFWSKFRSCKKDFHRHLRFFLFFTGCL